MFIPRTLRAAKLVTALCAIGAVATTAALTGSTASAATCGSPAASCTITGQLALTGGSLNLVAPGTLSWTATMDGTDMHVVDATTADQSYSVTDATGSGAGWHITASATAFTSGSHTLPTTALTTNGSTTTFGASTAPTPSCAQTGCTLPTKATPMTYPVTVGTSATPIYSADAGSGLGAITLGNVGWWLEIAPNTIAGTYTSTITVAAVSAP